MLISHQHRFVLLLPWKSASSTLRARLGSESPYSAFFDFNPHLKRVVHQHLIYSDFLALPESRLGYLTAAFVRNPYDRVFSGFRQLQRDIEGQPKVAFPDPGIRRQVSAQLAENFAVLSAASFSFEPWLATLDDHLVRECGRNSSFPLHPAHYWTHHEDRQAVDFVGRVETFESDFDRFCDLVGIEPEGRENDNVDASEDQMAGDGYGYRYASEMSPAARSRINALFADDFDRFGYQRV